MRFSTIICLLFFIPGAYAQNGKRVSVLFVGNSYTFYNNMPDMVAKLAAQSGDTLAWGMEAPGGYYFLSHVSENPKNTINRIKLGNWDYVVLQEQSLGAAQPDTPFRNLMYKYAHRLDSIINQHNDCAETIFYMTWGRKNGDSFLCDYYNKKSGWTGYCSYQSMDSLIRLRYQTVADSNNAILSPVGAVWRYLRTNYSDIELYDADESHPSVAGSYAAACCFYTAIFKKDPTLLSYDHTLSPKEAADIRTAVKKVVYDSMAYWHIGQNRTEALATHNANGTIVSFNNGSLNATNYQWYFGDGQTETAASPTHAYTSSGQYVVTLVANNSTSGCSDTLYSTVQAFATGIHDNSIHKENFITISPNPSNGQFIVRVKAPITQLVISDIPGHVLLKENTHSHSIKADLSNYAKGIYILHATSSGGELFSIKLFIE